VKGARNRAGTKKYAMKSNASAIKATKTAIENGKKTAMIEAYAKEHAVTVTQASIHFMSMTPS